MVKVRHISSQQLNQLVGPQLGTKLWVLGMMNELRRYPNEIPCEAGEIPSMRIPFASGEEKVEWGFVAGMSCLTQNRDGSILVQNADHFPSCATLAILSLLHDAGAAEGKQISFTLQIPDSPQNKEFRELLTEAAAKLRSTTIQQVSVSPAADRPAVAHRVVMPLAGCLGVVQSLSQTDIGRFVVQVKCVNGSFRVGDDATVTDGGFHVLQEHCPITRIVSSSNQVVQCSDDLDEDVCFLCIAMWFPPDTPPFNGLYIFKENESPAFTPRPMPSPVVLQVRQEEASKPANHNQGEKKSFWKRLFGG